MSNTDFAVAVYDSHKQVAAPMMFAVPSRYSSPRAVAMYSAILHQPSRPALFLPILNLHTV